jgi:small-conductance mechanosensitive channel
MEAAADLVARYPWTALALRVLAAAALGLAVHALIYRLARRAAQRVMLAERVLAYTHRSAQWLVPLLLVQIVLLEAPVAVDMLRQILSIAVILVLTVLVIRLIAATADFVISRHSTDEVDNLRARSVHTQITVLARTAMFIVGLLGVGSVLMTFPQVRQIGLSLLASAGLAGIFAGLAARPVLGNLIAGLQIALAQPLRVDDVLIVENEWGRVEEITGTYVVVRIWDERRLIVPLEYFITTPFQNWTRRTADLIGTVTFWVDYRMPVDPLREALQRIVEDAPEWDRRVCVLQVTEMSERAMQLRVLVSTANAGLGWDLRCKVREQLVAYMQEAYPAWLPQVRATLSHSGGTPAGDQRQSEVPRMPSHVRKSHTQARPAGQTGGAPARSPR